MRRASVAILALAACTASWIGTIDLRGGGAVAIARARAAQDWKKEFQEVCSRTQDAMTIPLEELRALVARCDKLKPIVDALDESERKVYGRRLKACRDLYQFVLESREKS